MSIRLKIILIVLPLLITALVISGTISSNSAESGMTRIAMASMGFKSQELNKYMDNQWNLLVSNELSENEEYIEVAQKAVASYATSIITNPTELIVAFSMDDTSIGFTTSEFELSQEDKVRIQSIIDDESPGWVEVEFGEKRRVGQSFLFGSFNWYVIVTEEEDNFYREVKEITLLSYIVLGVSIIISTIFLMLFTQYLTNPLSRVVTTMKKIITDNDLSARVAVEFKDEIGELAHTFNIMISELQKASDHIKGFAFKAVLAQRNEFKLRNIFQRYVPKDVINTVFDNPESMLVGENRVLAVLFSDIRSFTTISEGYMPDELVDTLNRYFELMVDIIMAHGGIIDKYIGDAIMAFFGAPVKHKNDALNAVTVALKMQKALARFNAEQEAMGKPKFITGIGINYGVVTVGNIGSQKKMDYTVIGDMVNLGSRLEGQTKEYKQEVIFSESVFRKVKDTYPCRHVDTIQVKGKTVGEKIYTAYLDPKPIVYKALKIHSAALSRYYGKDFKKARQYFQAVKKILPKDYIADMFLERCNRYIQEPPPPDWNGTEVKTSK